jgi:hypothetical protein
MMGGSLQGEKWEYVCMLKLCSDLEVSWFRDTVTFLFACHAMSTYFPDWPRSIAPSLEYSDSQNYTMLLTCTEPRSALLRAFLPRRRFDAHEFLANVLESSLHALGPIPLANIEGYQKSTDAVVCSYGGSNFYNLSLIERLLHDSKDFIWHLYSQSHIVRV